ncbi:MAG: GntR family transcriptional regulator [Aquisalimonadaceae bacterium]
MKSSITSTFSRSCLPLYAQVASELRRRIESGQWEQGRRLPTLEELVLEFEVARGTVRQAVALLEQDGLIWRKQGKGTFVEQRAGDNRWLRVATEWTRLLKMIDGTRMHIVETAPVQRPASLAAEDGVPCAGYQRIRRVHSKDQNPYCLIDLCLAADIYERAPLEFQNRLALEVLNRLDGVELKSAHQSLVIGRADMETAELLSMDVGGPVAEVRRVITDAENRVIYLAEIVYRGDFVKLEIDLLSTRTN